MKFYSTRNSNIRHSFRKAVLNGLAPDGGLYLPERIPPMCSTFIRNLNNREFREVAFEVAYQYTGGEIPIPELRNIVDEAFNFPVPLVQVTDNIYALELFHGPTLAFKDIGARFMARVLGYFVRDDQSKLTILVATSGDTGSAAANGFHNVEGIEVVILYPQGKVSKIQEQQLTTPGGNITTLEVKGNFDDCQVMVKSAFADEELRQHIRITSANSINLGRLIPQSFYYFYAYGQLKSENLSAIFSVPSGNFGNLTGGLIAKNMGLPVSEFIAATNANNVVPEYLESGNFNPRPTVETISNAMDVGDPSNFERIRSLYDSNFEKIGSVLQGFWANDDQTKDAIKRIYSKTGYLMDPHGAIGCLALEDYLDNAKQKEVGIFLETAHPAKFYDVVQPLIDRKIQLPDQLNEALKKEKKTIMMNADYSELKQFLLSNSRYK